jgi:hypothetical protein
MLQQVILSFKWLQKNIYWGFKKTLNKVLGILSLLMGFYFLFNFTDYHNYVQTLQNLQIALLTLLIPLGIELYQISDTNSKNKNLLKEEAIKEYFNIKNTITIIFISILIQIITIPTWIIILTSLITNIAISLQIIRLYNFLNNKEIRTKFYLETLKTIDDQNINKIYDLWGSYWSQKSESIDAEKLIITAFQDRLNLKINKNKEEYYDEIHRLLSIFNTYIDNREQVYFNKDLINHLFKWRDYFLVYIEKNVLKNIGFLIYNTIDKTLIDIYKQANEREVVLYNQPVIRDIFYLRYKFIKSISEKNPSTDYRRVDNMLIDIFQQTLEEGYTEIFIDELSKHLKLKDIDLRYKTELGRKIISTMIDENDLEVIKYASQDIQKKYLNLDQQEKDNNQDYLWLRCITYQIRTIWDNWKSISMDIEKLVELDDIIVKIKTIINGFYPDIDSDVFLQILELSFNNWNVKSYIGNTRLESNTKDLSKGETILEEEKNNAINLLIKINTLDQQAYDRTINQINELKDEYSDNPDKQNRLNRLKKTIEPINTTLITKQ